MSPAQGPRYTVPMPEMTDAASLDKSGRAIQDMFAGVAPRYDLLNHLLSASLDVVWRRRAVAVLGLPPGSAVLDLCCGTGDQAIALGRRGARVAAADFCLPMVAIARRKFARRRSAARGTAAPAPLVADALQLPYRAGSRSRRCTSSISSGCSRGSAACSRRGGRPTAT